MGIKVFDYNNDGRLDLFVTDMHSDMSQTIGYDHEKMKSDMTWPESFRGDGHTSICGNSLFHKVGRGSVRRGLGRASTSRTTGPGGRASAT